MEKNGSKDFSANESEDDNQLILLSKVDHS